MPARPWSRRSITSATTNSAVATIAGLVDRIGYDPVRLESLRPGRVLQPGGPVFGVVLTRPEFECAVRTDMGLITRRRDPENRRVHLVELTQAGEEAFYEMRRAALAFNERLAAGFDENELTEFGRVLDRLRGNVSGEHGYVHGLG